MKKMPIRKAASIHMNMVDSAVIKKTQITLNIHFLIFLEGER